MKKFIINCSVYIIIVLVTGNIISFSARYFLGESQFYKSSFLVNAYEKEKQFDYFITGSSRGLTTLNSSLIDEKLKLTGVNLSMDDTDLKTQKLMIQHFFNSGFKAKYCVLTLDDSHFIKTNNELGNNDYRFVAFSGRDYVKDHYRKYEEGKLKMLFNSKYFPLFSFSYYNLELLIPSVLSAIKPMYRNKYDEKGNYSYPNSKITHQKESKVAIETKEFEIINPLINDIVSILEENKCKLIIYVAPYEDLNYTTSINYENFTLINHSNAILDQNLFFDRIHVNTRGRTVATEIFTEDFKNLLTSK